MASQQEPSSYDRRCLTDSLEFYINSTTPAVSKCPVLLSVTYLNMLWGLVLQKFQHVPFSTSSSTVFIISLHWYYNFVYTHHFSWFPLAL